MAARCPEGPEATCLQLCCDSKNMHGLFLQLPSLVRDSVREGGLRLMASQLQVITAETA